MSKSSRTPHPYAGKSGKRATVRATAPDARSRPPGRPWVIDGIDYGPAIAAVHDLAAWAFDLAEGDVADWPEGLRRVRSARRFVFARLRGKRPHGFPVEDFLFTTGLFIRIFEADLHLPFSDMVAIFDQLGFPTDAVPLARPAPSAACWPQHPPLVPITPLRPRPTAIAARPAPADVCEGCGQLGSRFRIAA